MQKIGFFVACPLVLIIMTWSSGCGTSAQGGGSVGTPRILTSDEAKQLILQLPYRYRFRKVELPKGATGALAGAVIGKHHTVVHFGISLGVNAEAVAVPSVGVLDPYDYSQGAGFVFNDDMEVPGKGETVHPGKQFHTAAQWNEAANMVVGMQEKLCKASTGEPCPI